MNKTELVAAVAKEASLTQADSERAINAFIALVTQFVSKGHKVTIPGFMTVEKQTRKARTGRNPKTGEGIEIPAKNVAKFKAGKTFEDALN